MKHTRKLPPCDLCDVPAMENWLSDQAKKGLLLDGRCRSFSRLRFLKGEPADIRFRLEPNPDKNSAPSPNMREAYEEAGWEFVITLEKLFFVWKSTRPDAEELHTDPIIQSEDYRRIYKRLAREAITSVIGTVIILAIILAPFFLSSYHTYRFLINPFQPLILMMWFIACGRVILRLQTVRRLKQRLSQGIGAEHKKDYRRGNGLHLIMQRLQTVGLAFVLVVGVLMLTSQWRRTISHIDRPLPFLPLDVIEQSDDFSWPAQELPYKRVNAWNNVTHIWSLLVPVYYDFHQQGDAQDRTWTYSAGTYWPQADTEYYQVAFSIFSNSFFEDLVGENLSKKYTVTELSHPEFDRVVYATRNDFSRLFALRGKQIVIIRYHGDADLSQRLDALAEALEAGKHDSYLPVLSP